MVESRCGAFIGKPLSVDPGHCAVGTTATRCASHNTRYKMSSITTDLAALLRTVRRPGDFYASGTIALPAPALEVEGVGPIALPLLPFQAEQLIAAAARAPYGRGQDT